MADQISGGTRLCFVVADPVHHLRTPQTLNSEWAARGLDVVTVPAHVATGSLEGFMSGLRANQSALGAVVTVPHKQAAVELCDDLGPHARIVGAVNVIRRDIDGRLVGETFDGLGFVAGLSARGIDPRGMRTLIVGAGGAASAVAVALLDAGVATLDVSNRTLARGSALADRLRTAFPGRDIGDGTGRASTAQLIVNASAAGMSATDESPVPADLIPAEAVAAEVVMSDRPTPFLAAATARGARTHEGTHMLRGQIQLIADYLL